MLPRVILHCSVSLDGRISGFEHDLAQFYGLAARWNEDATLAGSDTILQAVQSTPVKDENAEMAITRDSTDRDPRPLLVIPDSRARIRCWHILKKWPYWRDNIALCSQKTPPEHIDYLLGEGIDCIIAGQDRVDLRAALEELSARFGVKTVRADSGGKLNGALLRAGLVDEVSLLVNPYLVGGQTECSFFHAPNLVSLQDLILLKLAHADVLGGGVVWLRYEIDKPQKSCSGSILPK